MDATTFAGTDAGTKLNAAFASIAGITSAKLTLPPGQNYTVARQIVLPGDRTGNHTVDLDCQGSTLTWAGPRSESMVNILGANANGPGDTGILHHCTLVYTGTIAAITQQGRLGFIVRNNTIVTSADGVQLINTNAFGGPGYTEEAIVSENTFVLTGAGGKGIHHILGAGGTNSFDYNWLENNHCQLASGTWCVAYDAGSAAQGVNLSMHLNTAAGGTLNTGGLLLSGPYGLARSTVDIRGEDTAGIGPVHFWSIFGGPSYNSGGIFLTGGGLADGNVVQPSRIPVAVSLGVKAGAPGGNFTFGGSSGGAMVLEDEIGDGGSLGRRSEYVISPQLTLFGLRAAGTENRGEIQFLSCDGTQAHALQSNCLNTLYINATNSRPYGDSAQGSGVGIGPGFGHFGGAQPVTPLHVRGRSTSGNQIAITVEAGEPSDTSAIQFRGNNPAFPPARTLWIEGPADGIADHAGGVDYLWLDRVHNRTFRLNKDGYVESPVGFKVGPAKTGVTKTCNSNLEVVGGIIVGCN